MKRLLRDSFASLLALFARAIIRKYKPKIVMVTGSVGKTSTKDALGSVLSSQFYVRASEKSYNSEFGVPLTIIGAANPWTNAVRWTKVFIEAAALLLLPNHYPKLLVLEVGADSPGDLARILKIATPDAVVVTRLPEMPVHVEAYASPSAVRDEEFSPAYALPPGSPLIVSSDDEYALALAAPLSVNCMTYGSSKDSDLCLSNTAPILEKGRIIGMKGTITLQEEEHSIEVLGAFGRPQLLAPAAAILCGFALGMTIEDAVKGVKRYAPPAGRGTLIAGKSGSLILDDSYNASPTAVKEALASLAHMKEYMPSARLIAALGDMLELGRYSASEHEEIGKCAQERANVLVAVGRRSRAIAEAAKVAGMPEDCIHSFDTAQQAAVFLADFVQENDIVLIKGSQSIRMERIAQALLEKPADLSLLVRQDREWKKRQ